MTLHQALASYLPESMLITLSPAVSLLDSSGNLVGFRNPLSFSYFFHEYVHYLHNISTVSGIATFINTIELWRTFRVTIDDTGQSRGAAALSSSQQDHLATLRAVLHGARSIRESRSCWHNVVLRSVARRCAAGSTSSVPPKRWSFRGRFWMTI